MAKSPTPAATGAVVDAKPKKPRAPIVRNFFFFYRSKMREDGQPDLDIVAVFGDKRKAFDFNIANEGTGLRMKQFSPDRRQAAELDADHGTDSSVDDDGAITD